MPSDIEWTDAMAKTQPPSTEEIDLIINGLRDLWRKNPHLRFGEILERVLNWQPFSEKQDYYYAENKDWIRAIDLD